MEEWEKLYLDGNSLRNVSVKTGIPKATLYRWLKKKELTRSVSEASKGKKLSEEHKQKISKGLQGKYTGWNTNQLKTGYDVLTNDLAYILGVLYGDGYIMKCGGIGHQSSDDEFAKTFGEAVKRQFGVKVHYYYTKPSPMKDWRNGKTYTRRGTTIMRCPYVLVSRFLEKVKNFDYIKQFNREQKISFVRGLWDSEGSVSGGGYGSKITFTHNTYVLCELFASLVNDVCGFKPTIIKTKQVNHVSYFYRKEYIRKFYETIQPTIHRKIKKFEEILST